MNITELCVKLRLPYLRENWRQLTNEAKRTGHGEYLFNRVIGITP
jgi:hypothetical protein